MRIKNLEKMCSINETNYSSSLPILFTGLHLINFFQNFEFLGKENQALNKHKFIF